jgi:hypothetical protein
LSVGGIGPFSNNELISTLKERRGRRKFGRRRGRFEKKEYLKNREITLKKRRSDDTLK